MPSQCPSPGRTQHIAPPLPSRLVSERGPDSVLRPGPPPDRGSPLPAARDPQPRSVKWGSWGSAVFLWTPGRGLDRARGPRGCSLCSSSEPTLSWLRLTQTHQLLPAFPPWSLWPTRSQLHPQLPRSFCPCSSHHLPTSSLCLLKLLLARGHGSLTDQGPQVRDLPWTIGTGSPTWSPSWILRACGGKNVARFSRQGMEREGAGALTAPPASGPHPHPHTGTSSWPARGTPVTSGLGLLCPGTFLSCQVNPDLSQRSSSKATFSKEQSSCAGSSTHVTLASSHSCCWMVPSHGSPSAPTVPKT